MLLVNDRAFFVWIDKDRALHGGNSRLQGWSLIRGRSRSVLQRCFACNASCFTTWRSNIEWILGLCNWQLRLMEIHLRCDRWRSLLLRLTWDNLDNWRGIGRRSLLSRCIYLARQDLLMIVVWRLTLFAARRTTLLALNVGAWQAFGGRRTRKLVVIYHSSFYFESLNF